MPLCRVKKRYGARSCCTPSSRTESAARETARAERTETNPCTEPTARRIIYIQLYCMYLRYTVQNTVSHVYGLGAILTGVPAAYVLYVRIIPVHNTYYVRIVYVYGLRCYYCRRIVSSPSSAPPIQAPIFFSTAACVVSFCPSRGSRAAGVVSWRVGAYHCKTHTY